MTTGMGFSFHGLTTRVLLAFATLALERPLPARAVEVLPRFHLPRFLQPGATTPGPGSDGPKAEKEDHPTLSPAEQAKVDELKPVRVDTLASRFAASPLAGCVGIECVRAYVKLPDSSYTWHDTGERVYGRERASGARWMGYVLNMTSQRWITPARVDFPLWWHIMVVVVPDNVQYKDTATLALDFGMNLANATLIRIDNRDNQEPTQTSIQPCVRIDADNLKESLHLLKVAVSKVAYVAANAGTIGVSLLDVPNSYEVFETDKKKVHRSMDFLKAFAYIDFLASGATQPERLTELPTAKAMVRAMDTVTAFTGGKVTRFNVMGYSKLGTTAFMAGALDPRVVAIAPAGIEFELRHRQKTPYEFTTAKLSARAQEWEFQLPPRDQFEARSRLQQLSVGTQYTPVLDYLDTLEFDRLHSIVDPSAWLSRLTVPKFMAMCTNDFVFQDQIDNTKVFFDQMLGQKGFLEVANCEHEDTMLRSLPSVAAFFRGALLNLTMPEVSSWLDPATNMITARQVGNHIPRAAVFWTGDANFSRVWSSATWTPQYLIPGDELQAELAGPPGGYRAGFIEFEYAYPTDRHSFKTSTPVFVVPQ